MYIKSMVLEGFKSYGKRIEINGFDREFNAITGFNGSGKSNILDAICFVLGITNLGQVRATSLQDLVYKSGQAGITKASVTITFDNENRTSSPMGYEHYEEITITRQVVIGGKNKYLINGTNAPNKKVQDLFCSVQLNVNNPHFLIMQGRITKVLNMKPIEILSMIEEAAGTRMYENKKQQALKMIEKKDSKLTAINEILKEEIGPKITKLKEERTQFVEFQRIERELEHCRRVFLAWQYVNAVESSRKAEENFENAKLQIKLKMQSIASGEEEIQNIENDIIKIREKIDAEKGSKLQGLEKELQDAEKKQFKISAEVNSNKENFKAAEKTFKQLQIDISDDENMLIVKTNEFKKVGELFQKLKEMDQTDSKAVLAAQEKFQKISSGLLANDEGENATLEQQLINAKQNFIKAETEYKQCEMSLKHNKEQLNKKHKDMKSTENEYKKDYKDLENKEKELKNLENELKKINYMDGTKEKFQGQRDAIKKDIVVLQDRKDQFESKHHRVRFQYKDPEPGFDRNRVKGLVCSLLTVKDKSAAYALEVAAGGKLYNVIVDTENTSKKILQNGQLQQRVTIIPLNKISGRTMDQATIDLAQKLVGKDKVQPALSLVAFPEQIKPAMSWIFGQIFICKDMETAKTIAFHERIMKKCVTMEGDSFDPSGTLSGGAAVKGGSILLKLDELNEIKNMLKLKQQELLQIDNELKSICTVAEKYVNMKQKYDLWNYEISVVKQRMEQTTHHKIKAEVEALVSTINTITEKMKEAKINQQESEKRVKLLEVQLKDSTNIREKQLKDAEKDLERLKKKAEESRKEWQKREQESETLELEIAELKKTIESGKEQVLAAKERLNLLTDEGNKLQEELIQAQSITNKRQMIVKEQKEIIQQKNKDLNKFMTKKEDIIKQIAETELDVKRLNHEINTTKSNAADCKRKLTELMSKYDWIEQDEMYFGKEGGMYDFEANKPDEMAHKIRQLESFREKLSRNINARAMSLLDKEEERYNEMLKRKKIVENDKKKIIVTIQHLDEKKKEALLKAWEQVNKDFGSIFSSLLPGANAKLQPPENQSVTDGLEVKIGFSGIWKESLSELSGGQRSLVALSLILAMLLFKPAPLYILDEVDAALDLSHTENIGAMLKKHFKHSQFIVVSLKDGMFNNANVLFTTRFVDGMSTITRNDRTKKSKNKK
ncbi:structural maintenance of chromosomes protein 2 [Prorops nasuta]|uniref:structural maintenance of chromosomes protein 2 n=1 Tax=Prorops nasuta TaxID=863751 RepID=UPI0034CDC4FF